jgi:hypothetical protein
VGVNGVSGTGIGVQGSSNSGIGVWASGSPAGHFESSNGVCVEAVGTAEGFDAIIGFTNSHEHAAVAAHNTGGGPGFWADAPGGTGIFARSNTKAAWFVGPVQCDGPLQCNGDHNCTGTMTVAKDIVLAAADCAEEFDITPSPQVGPGTVMVLTDSGALEPSGKAYDKKVAGIISGAGDYRPGMILDRQGSSQSRMPIALVGKVYCKVDAQYEPIQVGDLLTTSPTPGHAMKASDPLLAFGAVIGKALRPLRFGQGLVPVLVALQ